MDDAIAGLEKSAGQSELTRILGLNDKKEDKNPLPDQTLLTKSGARFTKKAPPGCRKHSGQFNGKDITVGKATLPCREDGKPSRDYEKYGARNGNVIGMKGAPG